MGENKSNNGNITVLETNPSTATALESFLGALAVSTFIVTWIVSLASPLLLFFAYTRGYHSLTAFVVGFTIIAYAPWSHGAISHAFQSFLTRYHPLYYNGATMIFEGGDIPSSSHPQHNNNQHKQTFFAVHPHGAFCIGWALLYHNPAMRGVRFCFAPALYASPFFRWFSRMANKPGSARI